MNIPEPLRYFSNSYPVDTGSVKQLICGERYAAVLLNNGNIGICANLQNNLNLTINDLDRIDYDNISQRVALNAYYNAMLNYSIPNLSIQDIYTAINFKRYKKIIMIGYFRPLVSKFKNDQIPLTVFDLLEENDEVMAEEQKNHFLQKADVVILSATSIANNTFMEVIDSTSDECDIFLLGPSSIIHPDMKLYKNVKQVFGSQFIKNDEALLDMISMGYGTRDFLKYGTKVMF